MPRNLSEKHPFADADKEARAFLAAYRRWDKDRGDAGLVIETWNNIPQGPMYRITKGASLSFRERFNTLERLMKHAPQPQ